MSTESTLVEKFKPIAEALQQYSTSIREKEVGKVNHELVQPVMSGTVSYSAYIPPTSTSSYMEISIEYPIYLADELSQRGSFGFWKQTESSKASNHAKANVLAQTCSFTMGLISLLEAVNDNHAYDGASKCISRLFRHLCNTFPNALKDGKTSKIYPLALETCELIDDCFGIDKSSAYSCVAQLNRTITELSAKRTSHQPRHYQ